MGIALSDLQPRLMGYSGVQGQGPCIVSPRYLQLSDKMDFAKRGRGRAASDLACWPVGFYPAKIEGSARWALPSLFSLAV